MKRVVVGISGGVDSSVAAYLLKEQGYEVIGLFMINWHDTTGTLAGDCPWNDDLVFAELVARKLDIPIHTIDFSDEYRKRVVDYMFREYQHGRTPNPDVLCNREIKFKAFLDHAQMLGRRVLDSYLPAGYCCQANKAANLHKVRSDGTLAALQTILALDMEHVGADAFDLGAQAVEKVTQLLDVRL